MWLADPRRIIRPCRDVQIAQVLINLMNNAMMRRQRGKQVEIASDAVPWWSSLWRTAAGPFPGSRAKMFQPFFTTRKSAKNTGMGLSISQGIVTNMAVRSRWMNVCTSSCSGLARKRYAVTFCAHRINASICPVAPQFWHGHQIPGVGDDFRTRPSPGPSSGSRKWVADGCGRTRGRRRFLRARRAPTPRDRSAWVAAAPVAHGLWEAAQ